MSAFARLLGVSSDNPQSSRVNRSPRAFVSAGVFPEASIALTCPGKLNRSWSCGSETMTLRGAVNSGRRLKRAAKSASSRTAATVSSQSSNVTSFLPRPASRGRSPGFWSRSVIVAPTRTRSASATGRLIQTRPGEPNFGGTAPSKNASSTPRIVTPRSCRRSVFCPAAHVPCSNSEDVTRAPDDSATSAANACR